MPTKPPSIGMSTLRSRRRDHARARRARDQQVRRDLEVGDQARRDRAAARLDAPGAVEQQHAVAALRQLVGGGGAGRTAADDDGVVGFVGAVLTHDRSSAVDTPARTGKASAPVTTCCVAGRAMRAASRAEATNSSASSGKDDGVGRTGRAEHGARDVGHRGADHAAAGKGDGLRRAPQAHARAFAGVRGRDRPAPSSSRWRRSRTPRWPRRARRRWHAAASRARRRSRRTARPPSATHEARQPHTVHTRSEPKRDAEQAPPGQRGEQHARQRAAVLHARQLRRLARREAEHHAGERLEDQVLRAVGQHRDEDEDREAARVGFGPDLGQGLAEARRVHRLAVVDVALARRPRALRAAHSAMQRDRERQRRHRRRHGDQALRRVRDRGSARRRPR